MNSATKKDRARPSCQFPSHSSTSSKEISLAKIFEAIDCEELPMIFHGCTTYEDIETRLEMLRSVINAQEEYQRN